jgi:SOS response regulatory protein OraA/RecX
LPSLEEGGAGEGTVAGNGSGCTAPVIESILLKGAAGEKVVIALSDGSSFVLHAEVFARSRITAGTQVDPDTRERLLAHSELVVARIAALRLIARAAQTRKGLERKLSARGFSAGAVHHAISCAVELGYLDDHVFAEAWLRSRMGGRPEGWTALYKGMLGRGVTRTVAEEVLSAVYTEEVELEVGRRLADGLSSDSAVRKLASRGFRSRAIATVLRELRERDREHRES